MIVKCKVCGEDFNVESSDSPYICQQCQEDAYDEDIDINEIEE